MIVSLVIIGAPCLASLLVLTLSSGARDRDSFDDVWTRPSRRNVLDLDD